MTAPAIAGFHTRADWRARAPRSFSRNITPGRGGVTAHYGGGAQGLYGDHAPCLERAREWQRLHMDVRGWVDLAYTGLYCNHGFAFAGRGAGVRTAANGTNVGNQDWYAVTWLGGGDEVPTPEACAAAAWWIDQLRRHGAGQAVNNHSDHKATQCAGNPIRHFIATGVLLPDGSQPAPPPPARPAPVPSRPQAPPWPLQRGWYFGPWTGPRESVSGFTVRKGKIVGRPGHDGLRTWQRQMDHRGWDIDDDGLYGEQSERVARDFQREKGLTVDGKIGLQTWTAAWEAPVT